MWHVEDEFGFTWNTPTHSHDKAERQFREIENDAKRRGWDYGFILVKRE